MIDINVRAHELYVNAEQSGADFTRRSTVRRQLIAEGYDPEEARVASEAVPYRYGENEPDHDTQSP